MMKKEVLIFLICILFIFGCVKVEQPKELTEVDVALSWIHEAQFAGLYAADQYGYFEEEGLKVNFHPYIYEDLAQELVNEKYDVAILQTDTLLLAREKGLPVKAIFADYKYLPTVYFSKKERNILKPEDLIGKTVGVAYSERYPLIAMFENVGVDVGKVNIIEREYTYDKLANDEYDVEAGWITDGDSVKAAVGDYNIITPYDYGVNWYADLIGVTEDTIANNPELVESFLKATVKGWQYAIENADDAALLTKNYEAGDEEGTRYDDKHLRFVLEKSIPLIHTGYAYVGWIEKEVLENAQKILVKQGVIKAPVNVEGAYTMQFLENIYIYI